MVSVSRPPFPPQTAMAVNFRLPSLIALKNAVRSAQFVALYHAFSMLQPVYTEPSAHKSAAPTR